MNTVTHSFGIYTVFRTVHSIYEHTMVTDEDRAKAKKLEEEYGSKENKK